MRHESIIQKIEEIGIIPVISINKLNYIDKLGTILMETGLTCLEITFRTNYAEQAIRDFSKKFPEILIGAGTILKKEQINIAIDSGAKFVVSPGFDHNIVSFCCKNDMLVFPGIATPSEINWAIDYGLTVLKFFPAESLGGTKTLKAISAPYDFVKFIPTGGINEKNLRNYLRIKSVLACGGSWIVNENLLENKDYKQISNLIIYALKIIGETRHSE